MRSKNFTGNLLYMETVRSCKPLATLRSTSYGHVTGSSEQWKVVKAKHTFAPMTVTFLYLLFLIPANRLLASVITRFDECIVGESKPRFGTVTGTSKKWMVVKANITLAPNKLTLSKICYLLFPRSGVCTALSHPLQNAL